LIYLVSQHTINFVAHGFLTGRAVMGFFPVGGLADFYKRPGYPASFAFIGLFAVCSVFIKCLSFPARNHPGNAQNLKSGVVV
jgi:hypothetical protein